MWIEKPGHLVNERIANFSTAVLGVGVLASQAARQARGLRRGDVLTESGSFTRVHHKRESPVPAEVVHLLEDVGNVLPDHLLVVLKLHEVFTPVARNVDENVAGLVARERF